MPPFGPRLYLRREGIATEFSERRVAYALLHDFLVVDCVSDVNVGLEWRACDGWVEVEDVGWF